MADYPRIRVSILALGYDKLLKITAAYSPTSTPPTQYEIEATKREFIAIYKDAKSTHQKSEVQTVLGLEMPKVKSIA